MSWYISHMPMLDTSSLLLKREVQETDSPWLIEEARLIRALLLICWRNRCISCLARGMGRFETIMLT